MYRLHRGGGEGTKDVRNEDYVVILPRLAY